MTIGKRIEARRIELGMTQDELAKKLGYKSRSSINKIEMGINELTQKKIVAIAVALDTTPEYIMGWHQAEPMSYGFKAEYRNEEDYNIANELINILNRLDREDAESVLNFARFQMANAKYKKDNVEDNKVG